MSTSNDVEALLARVAADKEVRLVAPGRRSGKARAVTIWFVVVDGAVGLGTLNEDRNWVRNARSAAAVELDFGQGKLRGHFADVTDSERHRRIRAAMARKYWPFRIASWVGIGQKHTFFVDGLEPAATSPVST